MVHSNQISNLYIYLAYILVLLPIIMLTFIFLIEKKYKKSSYLIAGFTVLFQGFHTIEHLIQTIYWFNNKWSLPYMTPIAKSIAAGLETIHRRAIDITTAPTLGMELLHFYGNLIFFIGILGIYLSNTFIHRKNMIKYPLLFEGLHLLEHTTLLGSVLLGASPWGASTLFSQLTGSQLSTHRIWWHFIMNIVAFTLTVLALTIKKFPNYTVTFTTIILTNFIPIIFAYFYGKANAGYFSLENFYQKEVILPILINPLTITGYYVIYKILIKKAIIKSNI